LKHLEYCELSYLLNI